jgi:plastocyanin
MPKAGPNLKIGMLLFLVAFGLSAPALYGGALLVRGDEVEEAQVDAGGATGQPVTVTIVSQSSLFSPRTIISSPSVQVTVIHDNRDAGVLHNVAFYTSRAATSPIFVGELFPGPRVVTESFTAPATPGSYFFRCDVHPDTMTGTFTVQ